MVRNFLQVSGRPACLKGRVGSQRDRELLKSPRETGGGHTSIVCVTIIALGAISAGGGVAIQPGDGATTEDAEQTEIVLDGADAIDMLGDATQDTHISPVNKEKEVNLSEQHQKRLMQRQL